MDPTQLKAGYDQTQYLSNQIKDVDENIYKSNAQQSAFLSGQIRDIDQDLYKSQAEQSAYLSNQIRDVDQNLFKTQAQQSAEILAANERANWAAENRNNRNTQFVIDNVNDKAARVTFDVNKNGTDNLLATERVGVRLDDNIYKTTMAVEDVIHRTTDDVKTNINKVAMEAQKNTNELIGFIKSNADQSWKNFNDSTRDVLGVKNDLLLSSSNQSAILAKQAGDNYSAIQIDALKYKADSTRDLLNVKNDFLVSSSNQYGALAKQASENYSTIQIEALKSKADLSKQMSYEYNNLKDILAKQEADRLRDELRSAEHKSLYFELRNGRRHHHYRRRHHH